MREGWRKGEKEDKTGEGREKGEREGWRERERRERERGGGREREGREKGERERRVEGGRAYLRCLINEDVGKVSFRHAHEGKSPGSAQRGYHNLVLSKLLY